MLEILLKLLSVSYSIFFLLLNYLPLPQMSLPEVMNLMKDHLLTKLSGIIEGSVGIFGKLNVKKLLNFTYNNKSNLK